LSSTLEKYSCIKQKIRSEVARRQEQQRLRVGLTLDQVTRWLGSWQQVSMVQSSIAAWARPQPE
jgi:hypothetical protein